MDQDLVVRAQHGDLAAFESMVVTTHPRLHGIALGILRDAALAEDAAQQALIAIWRHIRRLRDPAKFESWSYRLLVNACYDEAKRTPGVVPEAEMPATSEPVASDAFVGVVHRDQLERGFRRLSLEHRAVIVLRYLYDLPMEQVALALDVPLGTAASRLHRALDHLRAGLEADARPLMPAAAAKEAVR